MIISDQQWKSTNVDGMDYDNDEDDTFDNQVNDYHHSNQYHYGTHRYRQSSV